MIIPGLLPPLDDASDMTSVTFTATVNPPSSRRSLVYISGPYTAPTLLGTVRNILRAARAAVRLWRAGAVVFCPHLNSALFQLFVRRKPLDEWREDYSHLVRVLARGSRLLGWEMGMVVLDGWWRSPGAMREIAAMEEEGGVRTVAVDAVRNAEKWVRDDQG
ncbi:MAG: hypothetical protein C4551_02350 [Bacillota bacterium]|nr:MAG: hypothetical protein C4551_02350 [Bacillota bacterium]